MWDKKEQEKERVSAPIIPSRPELPTASSATAAPASAHTPAAARGRAANIGSSLFIKGEVSGLEDLTVEGRVEGKIDLKDHNLTIAQSGKVQADIHAKSVLVIGEVTGNIQADEKVEIADTGRLLGDIYAPRVAISDGAHFRGSVDMSRDRSAAVTAIRDRAQASQPDRAQTAPLAAQVQRGAAG